MYKVQVDSLFSFVWLFLPIQIIQSHCMTFYRVHCLKFLAGYGHIFFDWQIETVISQMCIPWSFIPIFKPRGKVVSEKKLCINIPKGPNYNFPIGK